MESLVAAEDRLTEILEREVALYEKYVPNKLILAEYLYNTKVRLLHIIENAFDERIRTLIDKEESEEVPG